MLDERTVMISQIELEIAKDGESEKGDLKRLEQAVKRDGVVIPHDDRYHISIAYEGGNQDKRVSELAVWLAKNRKPDSRGGFYIEGRKYWESKYWVAA